MHTGRRWHIKTSSTRKSSSKNSTPIRNHKAFSSRQRRYGDLPLIGDSEFKAKTRFKKAIRKVILSLRVTNVFQSCLDSGGLPENRDAFGYYGDLLDLQGNGEEDDCTSNDVNSSKPLFDPAWFKANREIRLGSETKTILSQESCTRTPEQEQTVFRYLRTLPSFAEYPLYHQKAICQYASYQSFSANATILKQGHRADNFYFVLSGSAAVISLRDSFDDEKDGHQRPNSVSVVRRGMAFGETAIMNNSLRNATVISKTNIELLVVSKEDYANIFLGTDSTSGEKEYITFLRTIDFLRDWPVDLLKSYPEQSQHCYFRRGTVIVRNSNCNQWLYVIKSGVCEVLVRLKAVEPRKTMGRKVRQVSCLEELTKLTLEQRRDSRKAKDEMKNFPHVEKLKGDHHDTSQTQRPRRKTLCPVSDLGFLNSRRYFKEDFISSKIDSITEEDFASDFADAVHETTEFVKTTSASRSSSAISRLSFRLPKLNKPNTILPFRQRKTKTMSGLISEELNIPSNSSRSYSLPSAAGKLQISCDLARLSRTKPAFVQIDLLHPKKVFGLSELDFEYNALHSGRPASVSLVSRGAECIMISKKFFMEHASALTKSWIRLNVQPYLPVEKHQETLQEKTDWEIFKKRIVSSVVRCSPDPMI